MTKSNNVLSKILYEAQSYKTIEDIEKLVEVGDDLSMVPIQPLYVSLQTVASDQVATILPKLSSEQRKTMLDLDLWKKDAVDVHSFESWIEIYSKVKELELTQEFVDSEDFLIYLKSRVNIYTFDPEDPEYPDHDFYFLTDDSLLLVEYSEEYRFPNELKYLIRNFYDRLGVENAYTKLFKLINDSYSTLEERGYQEKKERLREFGFVDYYEALEKLHSFISYKQIDNFVLNHKSLTPKIETQSLNQSLHSSALVSFDHEMENIYAELIKVKDPKRVEFLHFTFIRLINSTITLNDALKGGRVELSRIGTLTKTYLELGLQKIKTSREYPEEQSLFEDFDFFDLYRVGRSLISITRGKVLKKLKASSFQADDFEYFLGAWWNSFLENSEKEPPQTKVFGGGLHTQKVQNLIVLEHWIKESQLFVNIIPFIESFFKSFITLKTEGKLHDEFYLNYEVENIDFEAIIISSFINFALGNFSEQNVNKMGVSISELKKFFDLFFEKKSEEYVLKSFESEDVSNQINNFVERFGFQSIKDIDQYLYGIISEHLSGYEFDTLGDEDYKHIGGPILLNTTKN